MIKKSVDRDGTVYPAYGFTNDSEYRKIQSPDSIKILYGIKANKKLNSLIHGTCFSRINAGLVRFLIKEQEARSMLLNTKKGQKMNIVKRTERLLPHEMTTKLFDEMANLRLKKTGSTEIILERINSRFPKDKYSSFSYGLWRIKCLEEEEAKKKKYRTGNNKRKFVFFN